MFRGYFGEAVSRAMIRRPYMQVPGGPDFKVVDRCYGKTIDLSRPRYDRIYGLFAKADQLAPLL